MEGQALSLIPAGLSLTQCMSARFRMRNFDKISYRQASLNLPPKLIFLAQIFNSSLITHHSSFTTPACCLKLWLIFDIYMILKSKLKSSPKHIVININYPHRTMNNNLKGSTQ